MQEDWELEANFSATQLDPATNMFVLLCVYVYLDNKHMKRPNVISHYGNSNKQQGSTT